MSLPMTREWLALLMENETYNSAAENLRCGGDPVAICKGLIRRNPRYDDVESRNTHAVFAAIASGEEPIV